MDLEGHFMIVARKGRYLPEAGHDHGEEGDG
jgi:hypothetical protein